MADFASIWQSIEANGFNVFMIGWIVMIVGLFTHFVGGGNRQGSSRVPVLGSWETLQKGDKGFLQQRVGGWILGIGVLLTAAGGLVYFT